jgi:hypothetical protein
MLKTKPENKYKQSISDPHKKSLSNQTIPEKRKTPTSKKDR